MSGPTQRRFEKGDIVLGKLEVIRVLGEGGMGVVYEVEHRITKHRRALKLLHPHISEDAQVTARLLREASVAGRLRTKHVVETFDAGQLEDGSAYVLMEMLEGKSFAEILEEGRPPAGRVVSIIWEACEGLAVAHRGEIIHRDLKPDNMFVAKDLDGSEVVKILDFGISKFSERHDYEGKLTADGAVMGTPFYMSPEQTRGLKDIDGRTDIYAMGVILYEALSGRVPFEGDTFPMLVVAIHEGHCQPLLERVPDLDPTLAAVVHQAMHKDRAERFASVRDLQEALRPFADRELPERLGTDSAMVLGETMASDEAPRMSATATPMAVGDQAVTSETPHARPKWPLLAGVGLAVAGVIGLAVAMGDGATPAATSGGADAEVRGLGAEEDASATADVEGAIDARAIVVEDAGADAMDGGPDAEETVRDEAPVPTMARRRSRRNMRGMPMGSMGDGPVIDRDVY